MSLALITFSHISGITWSLGQLPPTGLLTSVAIASSFHSLCSLIWPASLAPVSSVFSGSSPATPSLIWSVSSSPSMLPLPQTPSQPGGLILSPAGEILPQKLLDKIRSRKFVDMKELLTDNIALIQQLEATNQATVQVVGAARPRLREVTSLASWCYCFLGYMAALTTDSTTRNQLAYAHLIVREAQRHGGLAWLDYDRAFRQQAAVDPTIPWNTLNPGLQAATMLSQRSPGPSTFCTLCRMVDHSRAQCALQFLEPPTACCSAPPSSFILEAP